MKKAGWGVAVFVSDTSQMCVFVSVFSLSIHIHSMYCIYVSAFQGDVPWCREAKGAVLAFVIIFNTVTQSESTLLKIPLQYL